VLVFSSKADDKATAKNGEVTLDADWQIGYKKNWDQTSVRLSFSKSKVVILKGIEV